VFESDLPPLFIFEMANNHMGEVGHGLRVMRELAAAVRGLPFRFAVKLQYRDLDHFIHPDFRGRADVKYVKRFEETRLTEEEFLQLRAEMDALGFIPVCTAFDEASVARVERHRYAVLKIGSCSFTDWPLLERAARFDGPIIASTAGATLEEIDRVVAFFTHRDKKLALMHCVAEYPTPDARLELNQIALLGARYPGVHVGYSTHERPTNTEAVQVAIALGARIFEKHVGVPDAGKALNDYSATPAQVRLWLESAQRALAMGGEPGGRRPPTDQARATLRSLQRAVFARRDLAAGEALSAENTFLAIPSGDGQLTATDLSKYTRWTAVEPVAAGRPVQHALVRESDARAKVNEIVRTVKDILRHSAVVVPGRLELEISHHYGIERFDEFGASMVTLVNRTYCKKLIVVVPGQSHPEQWHDVKEETFHVLWGDLSLTLDGVERKLAKGDIVVVERGMRHAFTSRGGCVIEELSSTHEGADSFYTDPAVNQNRSRKTYVTYWLE
jgi:sialic acid synthase SpsE/mannose-6-phosphate isomerase-like protein (cupin superfamily)